MTHACEACEEWVHSKRWALGYRTCRACGEAAARAERRSWTIVSLPKGHFTRIGNPEELKFLNQKVR
jgi:ribosomal protein L37AE/L43A